MFWILILVLCFMSWPLKADHYLMVLVQETGKYYFGGYTPDESNQEFEFVGVRMDDGFKRKFQIGSIDARGYFNGGWFYGYRFYAKPVDNDNINVVFPSGSIYHVSKCQYAKPFVNVLSLSLSHDSYGLLNVSAGSADSSIQFPWFLITSPHSNKFSSPVLGCHAKRGLMVFVLEPDSFELVNPDYTLLKGDSMLVSQPDKHALIISVYQKFGDKLQPAGFIFVYPNGSIVAHNEYRLSTFQFHRDPAGKQYRLGLRLCLLFDASKCESELPFFMGSSFHTSLVTFDSIKPDANKYGIKPLRCWGHNERYVYTLDCNRTSILQAVQI